jgi:hypothetical protein
MELQWDNQGSAILSIEIPEAKKLGDRISMITSGSPRIVKKRLLKELQKVLTKVETKKVP